MSGEKYTFDTARIRLDEIAAEVRKKDTSLEKSLDLLEEGVRLANVCTELVDHTSLDDGPVVRDLSEIDGIDGQDAAAGADGGPGAPDADSGVAADG